MRFFLALNTHIDFVLARSTAKRSTHSTRYATSKLRILFVAFTFATQCLGNAAIGLASINLSLRT